MSPIDDMSTQEVFMAVMAHRVAQLGDLVDEISEEELIYRLVVFVEQGTDNE